MKVYEIITEAPNIGPTTTTPSGIVIPQSAAQTSTTPRPKRASRKTSNTSKVAKPKAPATPITPRWQRNQISSQAVEAKWTKAFGTPLTVLMRVIGIFTALTQLYVDLEKVEQEYQAGGMDSAEVESTREFLFGTFLAQVLVPAVAKKVADILFITRLASAIKWVAAGATGAVTGGATVVAALATEAFFVWFQKWIGSDEGKNWLSQSFFMPLIKTMGKIPEGVWSTLTGYYEKSDAKKADATGQQPNKPAVQKPQPQPGTVSADDFIKSLN